MVGRLSGLFSKHASNVQQRSAYGFTFHVALVAGSVDYLMDAVGTLSGTRGSKCFNSWRSQREEISLRPLGQGGRPSRSKGRPETVQLLPGVKTGTIQCCSDGFSASLHRVARANEIIFQILKWFS